MPRMSIWHWGIAMTLRDYQRFYVSQRFVSDGWSEQLRIAVRLYEAFAGDSSRVDNLSATGITAWLRAYSGHVAARIAATVSPAAGMRVLVYPWPWRRAALYRRMSGICRRANVRYGRGAGGLYGKLRKTSGTLIESAGGDGARHLGNTREVFEKFYYDARFAPSQIDLLPRPK